jgi:hypothetical protein
MQDRMDPSPKSQVQKPKESGEKRREEGREKRRDERRKANESSEGAHMNLSKQPSDYRTWLGCDLVVIWLFVTLFLHSALPYRTPSRPRIDYIPFPTLLRSSQGMGG